MLTPYMPQAEIAMMDMVFALKRPARVLEFGAGGSTVRWSALPFIERWVTIEHDAEWYARVKAACENQTAADIRLVLPDSQSAYIWRHTAPHYDLIFVDGLYRVECIKASPQWLAPGGVVVLHDASRIEYAPAWDVYPNKAILTKGDGNRNGLMVMWGDI